MRIVDSVATWHRGITATARTQSEQRSATLCRSQTVRNGCGSREADTDEGREGDAEAQRCACCGTDTGAEARRRLEAWKAGETGFPFVDAGMRQLRDTGFMHNRVRMIVASFLVKDLHLPWQWGAEWFLDQLVDGDMANNQHGWQWCAGCGTDAAPYFRIFNPITQGEKFDPSGDYIRRWVTELRSADDVHLRKGERPDGYPAPIVDHAAERTEALRRYQSI